MNNRILLRFIKLLAFATFALFTFWMGYEYLEPDHSGDYYVREGDIRLSDQEYEKALESFNRALLDQPNHRGALMGRALVYLQTERYDQAEAEFKHLIAFLKATLVPDDTTGIGALAAAYANLGILYDRTGRYQFAFNSYVEALKTDEETVSGPGIVSKVIYGTPDVATVRNRAIYLGEQLKLPPEERLLRVPEIDAKQRVYKP